MSRDPQVERILNTPLGLISKDVAEARAFFEQYLRDIENGGDDCQECGLQRDTAAVALRLIREYQGR